MLPPHRLAAAVFGDDDASDCNGHGTHNAALLGGLRFGVAKNAKLWSVRAIDCDGTTTIIALLQVSAGACVLWQNRLCAYARFLAPVCVRIACP